MLFLNIFIKFIESNVFGIDYGSEYIKVGMALPGKSVHVALNQQSKRLTPSYFSFWNISNPENTKNEDHWTYHQLSECSWSFGDPANSHSKRFPLNSIKGMNLLLNNSHGFKKREILALMLKNLILTSGDGKFKPETSLIVFSVEPWLSRKERYAIKESVSLINSTLISIIDSPTASSMLYSLEKQTLFINSPKIVLFFDFGASHSWVSIFKFQIIRKKIHSEELIVYPDFQLGGNQIDEIISNYIKSKFIKKNGIFNFSLKVERQFLDEARRLKELLTLNDKVDIKLEDLIDDLGISFTFTKKEFEELINPFMNKINLLFDSAINKIKIKKDQIDSIELLGGSTRVPLVQETIKIWSGMSKLNRTLNSDEAMALGAGYIGATLSSSFVVSKVNMKLYCRINVSIKIDDEIIPIFNETSKLSEKIKIKRKISEINSLITIIIDGEGELFQYDLNYPTNVTENDIITLFFLFDNFSLPILSKAIINETLNIPIIFQQMNYMESQLSLMESSKFISQMDIIMKKRFKLNEIKNDHESFIYLLKDKINYNETFKVVLTSKELNLIEKTIIDHENWIQLNLNQKLFKDYKDKLNELKKLNNIAENKLIERKKRFNSLQNLNNILINIFNFINNTYPNEKNWIPKESIKKLNNNYEKIIKWFKKQEKLILKEIPSEKLIVTSNEIDKKRIDLDTQLIAISKIPSPTPIPTEKPNLDIPPNKKPDL